jgi:hypothetical protein
MPNKPPGSVLKRLPIPADVNWLLPSAVASASTTLMQSDKS